MKDRVLLDIGATGSFQNWATIDWKLIKKRVRNLRRRIYRATQNVKFRSCWRLEPCALKGCAVVRTERIAN